MLEPIKFQTPFGEMLAEFSPTYSGRVDFVITDSIGPNDSSLPRTHETDVRIPWVKLGEHNPRWRVAVRIKWNDEFSAWTYDAYFSKSVRGVNQMHPIYDMQVSRSAWPGTPPREFRDAAMRRVIASWVTFFDSPEGQEWWRVCRVEHHREQIARRQQEIERYEKSIEQIRGRIEELQAELQALEATAVA